MPWNAAVQNLPDNLVPSAGRLRNNVDCFPREKSLPMASSTFIRRPFIAISVASVSCGELVVRHRVHRGERP